MRKRNDWVDIDFDRLIESTSTRQRLQSLPDYLRTGLQRYLELLPPETHDSLQDAVLVGA